MCYASKGKQGSLLSLLYYPSQWMHTVVKKSRVFSVFSHWMYAFESILCIPNLTVGSTLRRNNLLAPGKSNQSLILKKHDAFYEAHFSSKQDLSSSASSVKHFILSVCIALLPSLTCFVLPFSFHVLLCLFLELLNNHLQLLTPFPSYPLDHFSFPSLPSSISYNKSIWLVPVISFPSNLYRENILWQILQADNEDFGDGWSCGSWNPCFNE